MTRHARFYATAALAASVLGAASLTVAAPAQAASYSATVTCNNTGSASQTLTPGLVVGDSLTITYNTSSTPCTYIAIVPRAGQPLSGLLALTPTSGANTRVANTYLYPLDGSGTVTLQVDEAPLVGSYIVNLGNGQGTSPNIFWGATTGYVLNQGSLPEVSEAGAAGPGDVLQQVRVPSTGNCADVVDDGFRYGTTVTGGWGKSWAQWINPGVGGEVCTRTLTYSSSLRTWVVAS